MALDPDTLETLIETVAKFVDERPIPLEAQASLRKTKFLTQSYPKWPSSVYLV